MDDFLDGIFMRWLTTYKADFLDDMVLRGAISRFEHTPNHAGWIKVFNDAHEKYMESHEGKKDFAVYPREILTNDDIIRLIDVARQSTPNYEPSSGASVMTEVLDLSLAEQRMLDFAIHMENCAYSYHETFENFRFNEPNKQTDHLYAVLLGVGDDDIRKVREGFLFSAGLLHFGESVKSYPRLHSEMADILAQEDLTVATLASELFPSSISSNLTIENYSHLSDEISLCENVINNALSSHTKGVNIMYWGVPGCGKSELALVLARKNDWNLIVVGDYGSRNGDAEKSRAQRLTSLKVALKLYSGAQDKKTVILFDECEDLVKIDLQAAQSKAFINRILENSPCPIILTTNSLESFDQAFLRRMKYNIEFASPPMKMRAKMWKHYREVHGASISDEQIEEFAEDFKISPALIENSVRIAKATGAVGDNLNDVVTSLERLVNYGEKRKKEVKARTDIPYSTKFINSTVDIQRLERQMIKTTGSFTCCLFGISGSGKSEFARHIANKMGKKTLMKKASDILGAFVGENEKNLVSAFAEADEDDRILIFDECDIFVADRRDASRNWEASLTNTFLQCIEQHNKPLFVTTNMPIHKLDPATLRRFIFKAEFGYLTSEMAGEMFEAYFGQPAPYEVTRLQNLAAGDLDLVQKKATILELGGDDIDLIADMLIEECSYKECTGTRMGF